MFPCDLLENLSHEKSDCGNAVPMEPVSAMDKPRTRWLSEILSKREEKTQYYNSLKTPTTQYRAQIQPGKLALQTGEFNQILNYRDTL